MRCSLLQQLLLQLLLLVCLLTCLLSCLLAPWLLLLLLNLLLLAMQCSYLVPALEVHCILLAVRHLVALEVHAWQQQETKSTVQRRASKRNGWTNTNKQQEAEHCQLNVMVSNAGLLNFTRKPGSYLASCNSGNQPSSLSHHERCGGIRTARAGHRALRTYCFIVRTPPHTTTARHLLET